MEFGKKLQKLRNNNNWTQEQLAEKLYVSRTAVSKWESNKGYPNIDSLKDISKLFNVTIDELLSSEELIDMASNENRSNIKKVNNLIFGLLDIISILFIFLPIYPKRIDDFVYSVSLISINDIGNNIKMSYIVILLILSIIGIVELILNFIDDKYKRIVNMISLVIETFSVLFFAISRQSYLTVIVFAILIIKISIVTKSVIENK